jgi:hypothetical protein
VWIGTIDFRRDIPWNAYYISQDGKVFNHFRAAELYLKDAFWLYGDPPSPNFIMRWRIKDWKSQLENQ